MENSADRHLKSFFEIELEWIADSEWQRRSNTKKACLMAPMT
jgi:hypothetical protein